MMTAHLRQRGATLIICMVILLVVTVLGVGSIQDTTLQEKMAANMKNRNMAFQAAESALRGAENYLNSTAVLPDFDGTTTGLYAQIGGNDPLPDTWSDAQWVASGAVYSGGAIGGVDTAPRYILEQMASTVTGASLQAGQPLSSDDFYRITVRAVGGTATARVIAQSIYKR